MKQSQEQQTVIEPRPVISMIGEKLALGPWSRDQVVLYHRWINDFAVLRTLRIPWPSTLEEIEAAYDGWIAEERQRTAAYFSIYVRETLQPIGVVNLGNINYRESSADFGIEIGEAAYRGRGYGTEATRLILDYAFTALGLHSVALETWEYNLAARRAYAKAGFRETGRRRQAKFFAGKLWDIIYMDCLATEFGDSPVLSKMLVPDEPRQQAEDK
ncbi:MAG TPA: GNAT family protein [Ktedonobacterales bacterium]|jgi:RimJ/RimL family protein N-acetyltransferase